MINPPIHDGRRPLLLQALLILTAGYWVFAPAFYGGWLWDDNLYVTQNPLLNDPARLWKIWFQPGCFPEYYPITQTVLWLQWQLWQDNTLGYHLTSVALHLVSAFLVWRLLSKFGLRLAWWGGLLFAVHPVMVESVAWMAELKNTLSLPPFLLAMCAWIDYEEHRRDRDYWLALALFLAAMLCKITAAPFPVVLLLYAWWKRGRIGWGDLRASTPFFAISLALGVATILCGALFQQIHNPLGQDVDLGGFFSRLALAGFTLSFYIGKCFWPVGLLPIYPQWDVHPFSPLSFVPWLALVGVVFACWKKRRTWGRHILLGLGFFLLILSPFLGFHTVTFMDFTWVMDHFLYVPILGLIGLVVAGLGWAEGRILRAIRPWGIALAAMATALMALESHDYAGKFSDQETLWTYTLQHNPAAWMAHINLGQALGQKGNIPEAMEHFAAALRMKPDNGDAHYDLGAALVNSGRTTEAMQEFAAALKINPNNINALDATGNILLQTNQLAEASDVFERALRVNPRDDWAHYILGNIALQGNQLQEAMEHYAAAIRINPDNARAHSNLGVVLARMGHLPDAIDQFAIVIDITPDDPAAHNNLGSALMFAGRFPEAIEQYQMALRLKPDFADAQKNLARVQALQNSHGATPK